MNSSSVPEDTSSTCQEDILSLDFDGDGVADVVIRDTNGHTVYVNVRWLVALATTGIAAVITALSL